LIAFSFWVWLNSNALRLRYDELLEIQAASAPTAQQVLSYLAAGVDYNPPLSHFLVRTSMALFGTADWAMRLPSFLGMLTCLVCVYFLVSQWLSRTFGVLAILILICSPLRIHAGEARPYGLVLGLTGLALILYRQAAKPGRNFAALGGFALCNACLVASHYYAVLVASPFLLAEAVKIWKSRKVDWPLLACIGAPPAIVLAALANVIRAQHVQLAHYFSRGNLLSFNHGYEAVEMDPLIYGIALTLIAGAAVAILGRQKAIAPINFLSSGSQGLLLGLGLLLLPLEGAVCTQFVTHAYVSRYFLPAEIGFAICLCYVAKFLSGVIPGSVVGLIVAFVIGFANITVQQLSHPPSRSLPGAPLYGAQAPILFDSPEDYLRILHYQPDLGPKMLVIADPAASLRSRQYDTDDKIMLALASKGAIHTTTLSDTARKWSRFSLIPRPQEYGAALQCLVEAGGQVNLTRGFGASNFLFDVTLPPQSVSRIDGCSTPTH
jgi:4-amino-4-deoxy-L-arabinose transferase-like glycosyltransferase